MMERLSAEDGLATEFVVAERTMTSENAQSSLTSRDLTFSVNSDDYLTTTCANKVCQQL